MNTRILLITAIVAISALSVAQVGRARYEARLTGAAPAKGKAKFQTRGTQAELEIEGENLRAGAMYKVKILNLVYNVQADALRNIRVEKRWNSGAPPIGAGVGVQVCNAANQVVLAGTLAQVR